MHSTRVHSTEDNHGDPTLSRLWSQWSTFVYDHSRVRVGVACQRRVGHSYGITSKLIISPKVIGAVLIMRVSCRRLHRVTTFPSLKHPPIKTRYSAQRSHKHQSACCADIPSSTNVANIRRSSMFRCFDALMLRCFWCSLPCFVCEVDEARND